MKIISIAAGAAGAICGNCLRDNTLAAAMIDLGHDIQLVPAYTPIRTDETDVSSPEIFYGGVNVYLQQKFALFRHTPRWIDRWLDSPALLNWVSRFAVKTKAEDLGEMTVSVIRGEHGAQRKELDRLVAWLKSERPEAVTITNSMLCGMAAPIRRELGVPVLCWLQGEDMFLESLPAPYRKQALDAMLEAAKGVDHFLSPSSDHAHAMAPYLGRPAHEIGVILPGIHLEGYQQRHPPQQDRFVIGYLARVAPDKGLHLLAEAVHDLRNRLPAGAPKISIQVAGWLGQAEKPYLEEVQKQVQDWGWHADFEYLGYVDRPQKLEFLRGLDVLSVPISYRAPKGMYVLEALACGVPVAQPNHGAFPELIEATGGGLLFEPNSAADLARVLDQMIQDRPAAEVMGRQGRAAVYENFPAERMARETLTAIKSLL